MLRRIILSPMMILIFDFECPKKSRNVVNSVIDTRRTSNLYFDSQLDKNFI